MLGRKHTFSSFLYYYLDTFIPLSHVEYIQYFVIEQLLQGT